MEENNWRCPRCLKHVESIVAKCSCTLNFASQEQENIGVDRYGSNQTKFEFQQQEQNILKNFHRIDDIGKIEYFKNNCNSALLSQNLINTSSEGRNLKSYREEGCLQFKVQTLQELEVQPNQFCDANFSDSQESSKMNKESLYKQAFLQPGCTSQIGKQFYAYSKEFDVEQPIKKNLAVEHEKYIYNRNFIHGKEKLNPTIISNKQHSLESYRTLNIWESQPLKTQYSVHSIAPTTPNILEIHNSQKYAFQMMDDQKCNPRFPFLGQFLQERITSNDNIHLISSDNEQASQESNYLKNTFHAESNEGYVCHNNTDTNNSAFPNNYFANEALLPLSQHRLKENIIENSSQQYQARRISEDLLEPYGSQECLPLLSDPLHYKNTQAAFNDRCNNQSMTDPAENIFQGEFCASHIKNLKRKMSTLPNQYSSNEEHLLLNQQGLGKVPFCWTDQLYQNTTPGTTYEDQNSQNSPLYTTTSSENLTLTTPVCNVHKNKANLSKVSNLESNSLYISQQYENWYKGNTYENEVGYEGLSTSFKNDKNVSQDSKHSFNSMRTSNKLSRSCNLEINNKEKPPIGKQYSYCHNMTSFSTRRNLNINLQMHSIEGPFKCNMFPQNLNQKSLLASDIQTHPKERKYECNICKRNFTKRTHLIKHMRIHTKERSYKCQYCQLSFTVKTNLLNHVRTHTNERPYQCEICYKRFKQKGHIDEHIRTHTNERPYQCEICHKRFKIKVHMNVHIRTHTNERPYQCEICHKRFKQKSHIDPHIRTHTNERPYKCNICHKCFSTKQNLQQHMLIHAN